MKSYFLIAAASASAFILSLGSASANVITVDNVAGGATITCTGAVQDACLAFIGGAPDANGDPTTAGVLSSSMADLYDAQPSNEADEALALSTLIGTPGIFTKFDGDKNDPPLNPLVTFAEYVMLKLGDVRVFLYNNTGGELTITYNQGNSSGLGLSHTTSFGEVSEVPVPGAIWLMGAGLAGLGFARRRKMDAS